MSSEPGKGSTLRSLFAQIKKCMDETAPPPVSLVPARFRTILLVEIREAVRDLIHTILDDTTQLHSLSRYSTRCRCTAFATNSLFCADATDTGISSRNWPPASQLAGAGVHVPFHVVIQNVIADGGVLEKGITFLQNSLSPANSTQKVHGRILTRRTFA